MKHIHLQACSSTQDILKEKLNKDSENQLLISTSRQNQGYGRRGNHWQRAEKCLAFSFSLSPNNLIQLTTLEIACLISDFFNEIYNKKITLKWPNDLIHQNKKVGGIIANLKDNKILCGVGINFSDITINSKNFFKPGFIDIDLIENYQKEIPRNIVNYINLNRISSKVVIERFNKNCDHLKSKVRITDIDQNRKECEGIFEGINEDGAALIKTSQKTETIFNGSLFYN